MGLSLDQRTVEGCTDTPPADVDARVLSRVSLDEGPDLAVAVALTHDVTAYLRDTAAPIRELIVLGPTGGPGQTSVPDALMLGHHWNLMPPAVVYEHLDPGYAPTTTAS